ncbi:MAG TPA: DMT family transporter [Anaerolineae bacterium]
MLLGVLLGLASAFIWATASLAIKAQSDRIDTSSFNAFRMIVGTLFMVALFPFFGGWDALTQVPATAVILLAVSSIIGVAMGDTLYFWSMTKIGASRALPISSTYPLFTWALAVPLLGEKLTIAAMVGTVLVLAGVYLLSPRVGIVSPIDARTDRIGIIAALAAAALWAVATMLLKVGLQDGTPVVIVNLIRLPVAAIATGLFTQHRFGLQVWRGYNLKTLPMLVLLAVYSTGIGMIIWTLTVDYAGAARASLLNTAAPLIGVPLSALFLRERVTRKIAVGTLLSVVGIWMIL